jgi:hypothetical protein
MRLWIKKSVLLSCLVFPLALMAGTMGSQGSAKNWFIPIQGGFYAASQGEAQHINIESLIGNHYTVRNNSPIGGLAGIGFYFNGFSQELFQLAYGLNLFYLGSTSVRGNIIQEDLFNNLSYRYNIQNLPLYAAAKAIIYTPNPKFNVTVDAGIGPNFMWTSNYRERPLADFVIPDRAFKGAHSTEFSATAGAGIRMNDLFGTMPIECGYRFFYLGKGNLNRQNDQYLNDLNTGDAYANALVCSVTV